MTASNDETLAAALSMNWQNSGVGHREPIEVESIPEFVPSEDSGIDGYSELVAGLNDAAGSFTDYLFSAAEVADQAAENTEAFRQSIENLINGINAYACSFIGGDVEFMDLLAAAFIEAEELAQEAVDGGNELAEAMRSLTEQQNSWAEELEARIGELEGAASAVQTEFDPQAWQDPGDAPTDDEWQGLLDGVDSNPMEGDAARTAVDGSGTSPGGSSTPWYEQPNAAAPGMSSAANGAAPASDLATSMLPLFLSNMANPSRSMDEAQRVRDVDQYNSRPGGIPGPGVYPPSKMPTGPSTPSADQPATRARADSPQSAGPPTGATAPTDTRSGPGRRPPTVDEVVEYIFPDGQTQRVSALVARALDRAFAGKDVTDAQSAYEKSPAQWSVIRREDGTRVDGDPSDRIGPDQLITGDVSLWEDRTAVVIVWGPDAATPLELIVDGAVQPFASEMRDKAGDFGPWRGFMHPKGVTAPESGTPAATQAIDQMAVPVVPGAPAV
ncbi:hypothetical protein [Nocardia sp. NBC_00416]|uniref:hypothetical protein n=1 Tax=Nocardia sp. NBC_00416 TaxID=2975991 RepID=UPI002E1FE17E